MNPSAYVTRPQAYATHLLLAFRKELLGMKYRGGRAEQLLKNINLELAKRPKP